jgi:hypothetical protein
MRARKIAEAAESEKEELRIRKRADEKQAGANKKKA